MTPYQFTSNNPISNLDLDGLEGVNFNENTIRGVFWGSIGFRHNPGPEESKEIAKKLLIGAAKVTVAAGIAVIPVGDVIEGAGAAFGLATLLKGADEAADATPIIQQLFDDSKAIDGETVITPETSKPTELNSEAASGSSNNVYSHAKEPLAKNPDGTPAVDNGKKAWDKPSGPHTQLGSREGSKGPYSQSREFDENGNPVKTIDHTDHGRPSNHTNPHQHKIKPNSTGGTPERGNPEPLSH